MIDYVTPSLSVYSLPSFSESKARIKEWAGRIIKTDLGELIGKISTTQTLIGLGVLVFAALSVYYTSRRSTTLRTVRAVSGMKNNKFIQALKNKDTTELKHQSPLTFIRSRYKATNLIKQYKQVIELHREKRSIKRKEQHKIWVSLLKYYKYDLKKGITLKEVKDLEKRYRKEVRANLKSDYPKISQSSRMTQNAINCDNKPNSVTSTFFNNDPDLNLSLNTYICPTIMQQLNPTLTSENLLNAIRVKPIVNKLILPYNLDKIRLC